MQIGSKSICCIVIVSVVTTSTVFDVASHKKLWRAYQRRRLKRTREKNHFYAVFEYFFGYSYRKQRPNRNSTMNSRFLVSASKRRLLTGAINRRTVKGSSSIGRINGNSNGAVRPFHSSLASADALDMADTFARRHSKFSLGVLTFRSFSRDRIPLFCCVSFEFRNFMDVIGVLELLQKYQC